MHSGAASCAARPSFQLPERVDLMRISALLGLLAVLADGASTTDTVPPRAVKWDPAPLGTGWWLPLRVPGGAQLDCHKSPSALSVVGDPLPGGPFDALTVLMVGSRGHRHVSASQLESDLPDQPTAAHLSVASAGALRSLREAAHDGADD